MLYSAGDEKKEISLKIKTVVIDEENPNIIAEELEKLLMKAMKDELDSDDIADALGEDQADEFELCTEAYIETDERGLIVVSYMENEDDEQLHNLSRIIFNPLDTDLLMMSKEGALNSVLSFEEGKTHVCSYDTPFMPFKIYVTTKKLENRILESGKLKLEYILNINDTDPQHFMITVTLKDVPNDIFGGLFAENSKK